MYEYFIVYSRFSLECKSLFEQMKQVESSVDKPIQWICCDHPQLREMSKLYTDTVPCLLVFSNGYFLDRVDNPHDIISRITSGRGSVNRVSPIVHSQQSDEVSKVDDTTHEPSITRVPITKSSEGRVVDKSRTSSAGVSAVTSLAQQMANERTQMDGEYTTPDRSHSKP